MKRFAFLGWGLLGAAFAFGCSSDDGGAAPLSLEDLAKKSGEVSCAKIFGCCTAEERQDLPYESEEACRTAASALVTLLIGGIAESEKAGRLSYDAQAAGSCIEQMQAASCAEYDALDGGACDLVISPLVPVGDACAEHSECIEGYCVGADSEAQPPVLGVCEALVDDGAPCEGDNDCRSDYCAFTVDGATCSPKQPSGEPCDYDSACASGYCDDNGTCAVRATECTL